MEPAINPSHHGSTLYAIVSRCQGAYAEKTLSGYANDLQQFQAWCSDHDADWAPATTEALAAFVDDQAQTLSIATIKRRVEAIKFAHRMLDLPSPAEHSEVRVALRRAARVKPSRPAQSLGLTADLLQAILHACRDTASGKRDAALIATGYDTLCRSSELAAMCIEHFAPDLSHVLVPRSKADIAGQGRIAYLSRATRARLNEWLAVRGMKHGPLFQGLHTRKPSGHHLNTASIRRIIKRAATRAELPGKTMEGLSGHSMRIGAAQDMMVAGIEQVAIMQAGGWKSVNVLARYVENAWALAIHQRRWERLALNA